MVWVTTNCRIVRDLFINALYRPKFMETCDCCFAGVLLYHKARVSALQVYCLFYVTNIVVASPFCSSNADSTALYTISEPTGSDKRYWSNNVHYPLYTVHGGFLRFVRPLSQTCRISSSLYCHTCLTFKRRIKFRLPFADIIRSSPYSPDFQDKG